MQGRGDSGGDPGLTQSTLSWAYSQGPILPATDPDPNLASLVALCSGETAHPRAL